MSNDDQLERQIERWEEQRREHLERMKDVPLPEGMHTFNDIQQDDGTYKRKYSPLTDAQQEFWADFDRAVAVYDANVMTSHTPKEIGKWRPVPKTGDLTIMEDAMKTLLREWGEPE
jgi:hypothetical protein